MIVFQGGLLREDDNREEIEMVKIGQYVKVFLKGEIDNYTVNASSHGVSFGDLASFELKEVVKGYPSWEHKPVSQPPRLLVRRKNMSVKSARKFMNEQLQGEGLRQSYRANIAMLIYDDQMAGIESRSTEPPTNLNTVDGCNSMAERIINLVFSS